VFKLVPDTIPATSNPAASSRRLLLWLVFGVVVLNVVLFLKFGLNQKPSQPLGGPPTNSTAPVTATNASQKWRL
jgi:hypothetical protein